MADRVEKLLKLAIEKRASLLVSSEVYDDLITAYRSQGCPVREVLVDGNVYRLYFIIIIYGDSMSTTIQVKKRNLKLLEKLKSQVGARSYDELIEKLVIEKLGLEEDMFGVDRGKISSFSEKDRMEDR